MKTENRDRVPHLRYDLILIAALLLVSIVFLAISLLTRVEGSFVEVIEGEDVVATYPLEKDGRYELGGGSNILVIEGVAAYVEYADCPGQHCVKTGKIGYVGESIMFAHNEIIITVKGEEPGVDIVS